MKKLIDGIGKWGNLIISNISRIGKMPFFCVSVLAIYLGSEGITLSQGQKIKFRIIAFHDRESDQAHISFVREADKWFSEMASIYKFSYESTRDWNNLNPEFLSHYNVVVFLDTRPDSAMQRAFIYL